MSIANKINAFIETYRSFKALNPHLVFEPLPIHSDFDGPSPEESKEILSSVISVLDSLEKDEVLRMLPWYSYNTIHNVMQNTYNVFFAYQQLRDQGSYQNFASHLDSLLYQLRVLGFFDLAFGEGWIEKTRSTLDKELEKLLTSNREVDVLKSEVKTLIAPAVAGSLSEAFSLRKKTLQRGRIIWAVGAVAGGVASIYATFDFVSTVSDAFLSASAAAWPAALIRSIILVPVYAIFGLAFSQYKKERDFEEEYAHKAAIAASLPNYGDLAREPAVRDQIVTSATNVIFTSPTARTKAAKTSETSLDNVNQLIDSISKLTSGKGG
jgi:hypothetical protein